WLTDVAILPLAIIPFAFGYSVLRYRLMDVELVVRRVFVYALTTLAIALVIGAVVYTGGLYAFGTDETTSGEITLRVVVAVLAMAAVVMAAAPVKNFPGAGRSTLLRRTLRSAAQPPRLWSHAFGDDGARSAARFVSQPASGSDERRARSDLRRIEEFAVGLRGCSFGGFSGADDGAS